MPTALGTVASHRTASGGPWTPAGLPNLIGWFNTDSYAGGDTWDNLGGAVDLVRDRVTTAIRDVGGGYNMVCSYATGASEGAQWNGAFGALTQPLTLAVAGWWSAASIPDYVAGWVWRGITGGENFVVHWSTAQMICGYNDPNITVPFAGRDNARHVFAAQHNDGSNGSWFDIDGVRYIGNNKPDSTTDLVFGFNTWTGWNTGSPTVFGYGEIVVVDGTISSGDLTGLYAYLKTKWGTP